MQVNETQSEIAHLLEPDRGVQRADPPLFVVGCGRSGTTMLRLMLDTHPELAIPGESHIIPAIWRCRRRYGSGTALDVTTLARDILRSPHVKHWGVDEESVHRRLRELAQPSIAAVIEAVYATYADQAGKPRWGDKTPSYVLAIPQISHLFPSARFIHLIRDGRDVAQSYLARPMFPRTIWEAAWRWSQMVSAGRAAGEALGPQRYLEVHYGDLVTSPEGTLQRICSFGGLRFDEMMLRYFEDVDDRLQTPAKFRQFQLAVALPPTVGLRDWRTQMAPADVLRFEAANSTLLDALGYERRHSRLRRSLRAQARLEMAFVSLRVGLSRTKRWLIRALGRSPLGW